MEQDMQRKRSGEEGENHDSEEEKWVYDFSLDFNGKVPLRASTGVWKASLFIIGKSKSVLCVWYAWF